MLEVPKGVGTNDPNLAAALRGDQAAFDRLIHSMEAELWSFCRARVHESELEDVMQEVRIAIWKAMPNYQGLSKFRTWAFGIAYNKVTDVMRKSSKRKSVSYDDTLLELEAAFVEPRMNARTQTLWAMVEKLPPAQAELIELHFRFGFTLNEIAVMLGKNLNTLKYTMCQAYARMGASARKEGWLGD